MSNIELGRELAADAADIAVFEARTALAAIYKISNVGQLTLPVDARRHWSLEDGGTVDVVDIDDIGVFTEHESQKRPAVQDAINDGAEHSVRKVSAVGQLTPPARLRKVAWGIDRSSPHVEAVDTIDEVLIMKRGRVAEAVAEVLPTMTERQRERLVKDIFARDKSLLRMYSSSKLVKEAFPQIYGE